MSSDDEEPDPPDMASEFEEADPEPKPIPQYTKADADEMPEGWFAITRCGAMANLHPFPGAVTEGKGKIKEI